MAEFIESRIFQSARLRRAFPASPIGILKSGNLRLMVAKVGDDSYFAEEVPNHWKIQAPLEKIKVRELEKWQADVSTKRTRESDSRSSERRFSRRREPRQP